MLLRLYRVSDRFGVVLLKLMAGIGDWLTASAQSTTRLVRRSVGGVIALLMLAAVALAWIARYILRLIGAFFSGLGALSSGGARLAKTTLSPRARSVGVGATPNSSGTVLKRTANHAETITTPSIFDQRDVKVIDDPLRIQNRRLSVLVLVMGLIVVLAVLWATDPSRSPAPVPVAIAGEAGTLLSLNTPAPNATSAGVGISLPTPIPTATPVPDALRQGGTLSFTVRERGQTDIWVVGVGSRTPLRLLADVQDERDGMWSPDGTRLAYASRQDGNWELYVYDLPTQSTTRITYDLSFQGKPAWSPDGLWLVYESYQGQNLDIYAVPIDGSQTPERLTDHPAPDYAPAWSPNGRQVAFVSLRDGNQDIYVFNLDTLALVNLTQSPLRDEDLPVWSPDGQLIAFSAWEQGTEKVFVQRVDAPASLAQVISFGRAPNWSPDGQSLAFAVDAADKSQSYLYVVPYSGQAAAIEVLSVPFGSTMPSWGRRALPPQIVNAGGAPLAVRDELFVEQAQRYDTGAPYRLSALLNVSAPRAFLSDRVNDSFDGLRRQVLAQANEDFLGVLDDAWWDLERRPSPGEARRNWHMTGRAIAYNRNALLGFPPQVELVREELGVETLWRTFVRVNEDSQSGQLGEPLRRLPWDFLAATQGDVEAFNNGGRLRAEVPAGYYVDLTQLAQDYGWERLAAGSDWRANVASRNFWMLVKPDDLDWYSAMLEIHTAGALVNFAPTATPLAPVSAGS